MRRKTKRPIHDRMSVGEAAEMMIRKHGIRAEMIASNKVDRAHWYGNKTGAADFWERVMDAIERSRRGL